MGKYAPLGEFLRSQRSQEVPVSFAEIERITGVKLPPKAQHYRAWWSNNPSNNVMTKEWLAAGFETSQVDMSARRLVFRRVRKISEPGPSKSSAGTPPPSPPSDRRHHPMLGALKGLVHIVSGTDLAKPADPDWAKVWDGK